MLAFGLVDMFVAQQGKAIPPVKPRQKDRGEKNSNAFLFLCNKSLGKFDSVLNGKSKKESSGS